MIRGNAITLGGSGGGGIPYAGPHTVSPAVFESTTLGTSGKTMSQDVNVEALPQVNSVIRQLTRNLTTEPFEIIDDPDAYGAYSITDLWGGAFQGCSRIQGVSLSGLTSVSARAFMECEYLSYVHAPSVTSIGSQAFNGCTSLSDAYVPMITSVPYEAFAQCPISDVWLESAAAVGSGAFSSCSHIAEAYLPCASMVGDHAFHGNVQLVNAIFPTVMTIGAYAFYQAPLSSASFGTSLTTIGSHAFDVDPDGDYAAYVDVAFDNVTSIGEYAFRNRDFEHHDKISLPVCEFIGDAAFYDAYMSEAEFTFGASTVCHIGQSALNDNVGAIYVPSSLYSAYVADQGWAQYSEYIEAM